MTVDIGVGYNVNDYRTFIVFAAHHPDLKRLIELLRAELLNDKMLSTHTASRDRNRRR